MAYRFGRSSLKRLETCHPAIQEILNEAIKYIDFSVTTGHRDEDSQNNAFNAGHSHNRFPQSKHNQFPSMAADIAPYPVDWNNIKRFAYLMGIIRGIALAKGIKIRTGNDWDGDGDITDQSFMDWPHFELVLD